ncbi:MAG: metallophosphoesterase [Desulfobacterales bacterium]|nr:MAG: metallophosphoesterase [Desulfobacterales bacterium]
MKILYTSDIHANPEHLYSMLRSAEAEAVEAIIVGGDIVPHYLPYADTINILQAQALYLKDTFIPVIEEFKQRKQIAIYLDLSNDDFIWIRRILENATPELFNLLHMQKHSLTDHVDIVGYMAVPPTPFYRKDWEKPDSAQFPFAKNNIVTLDGYASVSGGLVKTAIDLASDDTIENDLIQLSQLIDRPFIFVAHSPPYQTDLDVLDNGLPVGSISIRRFIENWSRKGLLIISLHGHIHGSPKRTRSIKTTIENTPCVNPGQNEGRGSSLRYVILELDDRQLPPQVRITYEPKQ